MNKSLYSSITPPFSQTNSLTLQKKHINESISSWLICKLDPTCPEGDLFGVHREGPQHYTHLQQSSSLFHFPHFRSWLEKSTGPCFCLYLLIFQLSFPLRFAGYLTLTLFLSLSFAFCLSIMWTLKAAHHFLSFYWGMRETWKERGRGRGSGREMVSGSFSGE